MTTANIAVVGLAVMGSNLARNLASREGNTVAVYNRTTAKTDDLIAAHPEAGFVKAATMQELADSLQQPRTAIIMVKAGRPTDAVIDELVSVFEPGDIIVDGGNALFTDTIRREAAVRETGIHFVGCGISGGEEGALNGPSLMPGGTAESYETLGPILTGIAAVAEGEPCVTHVGTDGAGHFVKMVHNGIEYGLMQAYAEGFELLERKELVHDVAGSFKAWQRGTVVRSWLLDLMVRALDEDDDLSEIEGYVDDSGEGRWTVEEAIANAVPMPAISASLFARFESRQDDSPAMKAVAALRNQFGGHAVKKA